MNPFPSKKHQCGGCGEPFSWPKGGSRPAKVAEGAAQYREVGMPSAEGGWMLLRFFLRGGVPQKLGVQGLG